MSSARGSDRHRIALFTDVADARNVASGELADRHRRVTTDVLRRIGGVDAHATGTGVAASFSDANRALICAVQIQRSFEDWGSSKPAPPVRAGISRGDEAAAAVAALAGGGEILVTESVRALAEPRGHLFTPRGELQIGSASVPLFALRWWEHD